MYATYRLFPFCYTLFTLLATQALPTLSSVSRMCICAYVFVRMKILYRIIFPCVDLDEELFPFKSIVDQKFRPFQGAHQIAGSYDYWPAMD